MAQVACLFAELYAAGLLPASELEDVSGDWQDHLRTRLTKVGSQTDRQLAAFAQHFMECVLQRRAELSGESSSSQLLSYSVKLAEIGPRAGLDADLREGLRRTLLQMPRSCTTLGIREQVKQARSSWPLSAPFSVCCS